MDEELSRHLAKDPDGLLTYEFIANNIDGIDTLLPELIVNMTRVDNCGQFCVSAARYLHAIDASKYQQQISALIQAAIDKDRERAYIGQLLPDLWGTDYQQHATELSGRDDNFRRIYKRIYPTGI